MRHRLRAGRRADSLRWSPPSGELQDAGLHARVLGEGTRTFVLLHGLAGSNRYFGSGFDVLAQGARVIALDLLGFGRSPRPRASRYDAADHARAVSESLERLQVRPPLCTVGHSAGCLVALELARTRPDWVDAVVAISPPFYPSVEAARARISRLGFAVRWFGLDGITARAACAWMCRHRVLAERLFEWLRPDLPPEIARDAVLHDWVSYSETVKQLVLGAQPVRDLDRIRARVLLVAGDRDPVMDTAFLAEMARGQPHVQLAFQSGGHDLPLTDPDELTRAILEWIDAGSAPVREAAGC